MRRIKEPEENLTGNVVWEIADNAQRAARSRLQRGEITVEHIFMPQFQTRPVCRWKALTQSLDGTTVDFNRCQGDVVLREKRCEHSRTGTDFHDMITALR
jgi:hypothetical protein